MRNFQYKWISKMDFERKALFRHLPWNIDNHNHINITILSVFKILKLFVIVVWHKKLSKFIFIWYHSKLTIKKNVWVISSKKTIKNQKKTKKTRFFFKKPTIQKKRFFLHHYIRVKYSALFTCWYNFLGSQCSYKLNIAYEI